MPGNLSFNDLKKATKAGEIDTVLVCLVDMQGRLMGKRFTAVHFVESGWEETHCCNYLLATDIDMATPDGYASTSWAAGYGDYVLKPDMETLRLVPWLEGTAMVLCDVLDHHTHEDVPHSPRAMLKTQIARAEALGLTPMMATELEFFFFEGTYNDLMRSGYRELKPYSPYNIDYHMLGTMKEEHVMRPIRNHLVAAGVPVENSKGEAEAGQEELNIRYAAAMDCADHHTIAKQAIKEIAFQKGVSATFLAKWKAGKVGSAAHIHLSLWKGGTPAFFDKDAPHGMSDLMKSFCAGMLKYAGDVTWFMAPYVNSYKRFAKGTFAPTKIAWSVDNRTAGFRLCGEGTKGVRMECRIPGSDMNPYLAEAALLAAGLKGIEEGLTLDGPVTGDIYDDASVPEVPRSLGAATERMRASAMLREAFGDFVVDHYVRTAEVEQETFDAVVTDWEIARGFEKS
ncbi:glutamine synthetase [Oceanicola sp. 22II-s10i]|uniref:glutamine synthetase family protein n=1 Tax=Oceanicola sp. 22II-s10i TaxID=1317116 RepID=UPI000B522379|nr:glutamine synthetase family protein [Oceanicola sp. 22II-s10i]OWU86382.1 glutamine synthetase [Oceanicola sp. 22II-s10i]